jgi:hypothetical protein
MIATAMGRVDEETCRRDLPIEPRPEVGQVGPACRPRSPYRRVAHSACLPDPRSFGAWQVILRVDRYEGYCLCSSGLPFCFDSG